jgi:hypothetical protein
VVSPGTLRPILSSTTPKIAPTSDIVIMTGGNSAEGKRMPTEHTDQGRRLPALSPTGSYVVLKNVHSGGQTYLLLAAILRAGHSTLLSRTALRSTPLGSASGSGNVERDNHRRNNHLSVPRGEYFSPHRLSQVAPKRKKHQPLPDIVRSTPVHRVMTDSGSITDPPPKTPTVTSPSNKIFSI